MGTANRAAKIALEEVGFREGPNNQNKYGWNGAWCGMFVNWVTKQAGVKIPDCTWTPDGVTGFRKQGRWTQGTKGIRRGDIIFFQFDSDPTPEHVGIVTDPDGPNGTITTVEGNTNDNGGAFGWGTLKKNRPHRQVLGYGRPNYSFRYKIQIGDVVPGERGLKVAILQHALLKVLPVDVSIKSWERATATYGPSTLKAYKRWQRSLGFTGADADGQPGWDSLRKLAYRSNAFRVN